MRNTFKVAKWEIKKNLKNKSFIIGLFITPIIFLIFLFLPSLFDSSDEPDQIDLYVKDELNVMDDLSHIISENHLDHWHLIETTEDKDNIIDQLEEKSNRAFINLSEDALTKGLVEVYVSDEIDDMFLNQLSVLKEPMREIQLRELGFTEEELQLIAKGVAFEEVKVSDTDMEKESSDTSEAPPFERIIPGAFAGLILFSIVISGMMIFQSASQEKKDKIAEIILSSLTPGELMQGKILGYFVLGLVQVCVWLAVALPVVTWKTDFPIFKYLFVPELFVLLLIAILGYLLYASLFVGIGATIEDVSTSGNFQGIVLMLPFLPLVFIGPVLSDPSGMVAKVASYIPFTSPAILIIRLSFLEEWPWMEVIIGIIILAVSVWLLMKLAGKIFKTGILLYGKNATPKEIWKWLWA